jgi:hypothetical protein
LKLKKRKTSVLTIENLRELVDEKIKNFDPDAGEDLDVEFKGEEASWCSLFTRHATCCDYSICSCGIVLASLFGAALPAFCLLLGNMIDGMGGGSSAAKLVDNLARNYKKAMANNGAPKLDLSKLK